MSAALPVDCVEVDDEVHGPALLADSKARLAQEVELSGLPRVLCQQDRRNSRGVAAVGQAVERHAAVHAVTARRGR